jgi:hypothetical protein
MPPMRGIAVVSMFLDYHGVPSACATLPWSRRVLFFYVIKDIKGGKIGGASTFLLSQKMGVPTSHLLGPFVSEDSERCIAAERST